MATDEVKLSPEMEKELEKITKAMDLSDDDMAKIKAVMALDIGADLKQGLAKLLGFGYKKAQKQTKSEDKTPPTPEIPDALKPQFEAIKKSQDDLKAENEKLQKSLEDANAAARNKELITKAAGFDKVPMSTDDLVSMIRLAEDAGEDQAKALIETLTKTQEVIEKSEIMAEVGSSAVSKGSDAYAKIESKAKEKVAKSEGSLGHAEAVAQVLDENPELYEEYNTQRQSN